MVPTSFGRPCARCGADIIAPEWSEYLSNGRVRHIWTCDACGHGFEDSIYFAAPLEGVGLASDT
jgi:ribosomal protein L37AE/L43A